MMLMLIVNVVQPVIYYEHSKVLEIIDADADVVVRHVIEIF